MEIGYPSIYGLEAYIELLTLVGFKKCDCHLEVAFGLDLIACNQ